MIEDYTRWLSKGKAGLPMELGVPLSILEEASGFVLGASSIGLVKNG